MRILIAGLLGGVVFFFWGFTAHVLLPIGEMGFKLAPDAAQDQVVAAMKQGLPGEGVYLLPGMDPKAMNDDAAKKAYGARATAMPYAFVVYQPQGVDAVNNMGPFLGTQVASDVLCGLVAAFLATLVAGFGSRLQLVATMGLFSWLAVVVPYWNWYRFPLDFAIGALIFEVVGWFLGGLVIAWWLGRGGH